MYVFRPSLPSFHDLTDVFQTLFRAWVLQSWAGWPCEFCSLSIDRNALLHMRARRGFGSQMANSPMVIMWPNSDGSITLSQRQASAEVMPSVVANPPRTATKDDSLSSLTGSNPKLVYTIPANTDVSQNIIWAFSDTNPNSADAGASIVQHLNSGPVKLNLGNTLAASSRDPTNPISTLSGSGSTPAPTTGGSVSTPLLNYQKMLVAHGILCVIGFLGILPAGALLARYMRTYSSAWFKGHHLLQLFICEWSSLQTTLHSTPEDRLFRFPPVPA